MVRSLPHNGACFIQFGQHGNLEFIFVIIKDRRQRSPADHYIFGWKGCQSQRAHIRFAASAGTHVMVFHKAVKILLKKKFFHNVEKMEIILFPVAEGSPKIRDPFRLGDILCRLFSRGGPGDSSSVCCRRCCGHGSSL